MCGTAAQNRVWQSVQSLSCSHSLTFSEPQSTQVSRRFSEMEPLGRYLKRERELRQISVAEVAQTTRIPTRIIAQLEDDELDALPADIFVRGYLRAYAR